MNSTCLIMEFSPKDINRKSLIGLVEPLEVSLHFVVVEGWKRAELSAATALLEEQRHDVLRIISYPKGILVFSHRLLYCSPNPTCLNYLYEFVLFFRSRVDCFYSFDELWRKKFIFCISWPRVQEKGTEMASCVLIRYGSISAGNTVFTVM